MDVPLVSIICGTMAPGSGEDLAALDGPDDWVSLFLKEVDGQAPDYMVSVIFVIFSATYSQSAQGLQCTQELLSEPEIASESWLNHTRPADSSVSTR